MIKVLVVDDSALVRKLFGKVLTADAGFDVRFARNGVEALAETNNFRPNVITLDIHMPEMDGLTCLNRIMIERPTPVVMVSSLTGEGADITLEALRLGAVDFVPKPDGAVSLRFDAFAPQLLQKVRAAATTKLKASRRLLERVQHRIGNAPKAPLRTRTGNPQAATAARGSGAGAVLVGTSTGGPPALEALLSSLPADFAWPIVIAQHMPASFTGPLAKRLNSLSALSVVEVVGSMRIERGFAYIGRGDADVIVAARSDGLSAMSVPSQADYLWHPSTDRLVRTAMEALAPQQLVGVLMTGMGNDGADAMALLHARGGRTIAEAEETAVVWGMPGELVKADGADWILPLHKIADQLQQLVPNDAVDPKHV